MSTKTISISEEAYNLLRSVREEKESFTRTIIRITKKDPLPQLVGILSKKEGKEMRKHIVQLRF